jgi:hypothetical protein
MNKSQTYLYCAKHIQPVKKEKSEQNEEKPNSAYTGRTRTTTKDRMDRYGH